MNKNNYSELPYYGNCRKCCHEKDIPVTKEEKWLLLKWYPMLAYGIFVLNYNRKLN